MTLVSRTRATGASGARLRVAVLAALTSAAVAHAQTPAGAPDLVVFDAARVSDRATVADPLQAPIGIEHVIVNGVPVIAQGQLTGTLPGKVLRGPGWKP